MPPPSSPSAAELRAAFDAPAPLTVGLEEEAMLLHPETLDLVPATAEVLARAGADPRFKPELPAAQLEVVTAPARTVPEAIAALGAGRRDLAAAAEGLARPAAAAVHPFAHPLAQLSAGPRYDALLAEYGDVARIQLVGALQVHVAVGGAERSLAVYNALRGHLPELAALAASAPFHAGRDTGLASIRPKINQALPRQGMPPALASWEAFADALRWGAAAGTVPEPARWWWELRPHVRYGTLELRVPDVQAGLRATAAVAAVAHCLAAWLGERHDAGEALGVPEGWRIEENRWSACRHGVEGTLADLETGESRPTREVLEGRLEALAPVAARLGCATELAHAHDLVAVNGAIAARRVAAEGGGPRAVAAWLAEAYVADVPQAPPAAQPAASRAT
jgi:glutamate---cysteine ligase / carboxylate-amine ligase